MTGGGLHALDPVIAPRFRFDPQARIATMGSCFAQHISRDLAAHGIEPFVAEPGPDGLDQAERRRRGYGVFSARYGNVYTVRQAVQLMRRAFGKFDPEDDAWLRDDRWVDPFRPTVEPDGFPTRKAMRADRKQHLAATRAVVSMCDVLVLTLGLTVAWRSRIDGAVFSLAPGVAGGSFDPERHEFVNFGVSETIDDLGRFARAFHKRNPTGCILLTVSPVPLVATFEDRHVLVSTVESKAILRAAAGEIVRRHAFVDYFPSFEIITATGNDRYFGDDFRTVTEAGVDHVMRIFRRHYLGMGKAATVAPQSPAVPEDDIICDEAEIAASLSGQDRRGQALR